MDGLENFLIVLLVVLLAVLVVILILGPTLIAPAIDRQACEKDEAKIGLPTKYEEGTCWVEIQDDLWVRQNEIEYYLEFVDVEKIDRSGF